jgi:hypothetical protein
LSPKSILLLLAKHDFERLNYILFSLYEYGPLFSLNLNKNNLFQNNPLYTILHNNSKIFLEEYTNIRYFNKKAVNISYNYLFHLLLVQFHNYQNSEYFLFCYFILSKIIIEYGDEIYFQIIRQLNSDKKSIFHIISNYSESNFEESILFLKFIFSTISQEEFIDILKEKDSDGNTFLHYAFYQKNNKLIIYCIEELKSILDNEDTFRIELKKILKNKNYEHFSLIDIAKENKNCEIITDTLIAKHSGKCIIYAYKKGDTSHDDVTNLVTNLVN